MRVITLKSLIISLVCGLFTFEAVASVPVKFSNLIVFGDSLSDAASLSPEPNLATKKDHGNNYWVKAQGSIGAPITSIDPVTKLKTLWPNDLVKEATLFDLNPNHTRYIYPWSQAREMGYSALRYNISYAWAGAETGADYTNDFDLHSNLRYAFPAYAHNNLACQTTGPGYINPNHSCIPGVLLQVQQYLVDVNQHPNPNSLIIIWAGGNDLFNNAGKIADKNSNKNFAMLLIDMLNVPYPINLNAGIAPLSNPVNNIKQAVILLMQAGVSRNNIYVINLPDLAKTPAAQKIAAGRTSVLYLWTLITLVFDTYLEGKLAFDYVHPAFNLPRNHIISSYTIFADILKNAPKYGFSKQLQNCVADHAPASCPGYIFFDEKHPTAEVHKQISNNLIKILQTEE